jgi:D-cysteine desulfhydrase
MTNIDVLTVRKSLDWFPRLSLGTFPSPVRQVNAENNFRFWIKDDGRCSEIYGGNKVRKLEYLLASIQKTGNRKLVVHGDAESHTVQACGMLGRRAGLEVHAVVFPCRGQSFDTPELARLREIGVCIHHRSTMLATVLHAHWIGWRMKAYVVPLGASTPVATLGHVRAAVELLEQVRAGFLPEPRRIYIPFATGGSVAGLLIGLALAGAKTRVVAVRTVETIIANRRRLERLVKSTLALLDPAEVNSEECLNRLEMIDALQLGRGYHDVPTPTREAISVGVKYELCLDPAFSGKAFAALLAALPRFPNGELLFWNTHDQHGLSAGLGGAQ